MDPSRINNGEPQDAAAFFDSWPERALTSCPSEANLLAAARGTGSDLAEHISSCPACSEIVTLLRASNTQTSTHLRAFLAQARQEADIMMAKQRPSIIRPFWEQLALAYS